MNNRQIKFRAWDTFNRELEYIEDLYWFEENYVHSVGKNTRFIVTESTGLFDINKVELFEGDICKYEGEDGKSFGSAVIDFFWGSFRLNGNSIDNFIENEAAAYANHTSLEKIGNIFENPELIKT